jgi:glucokinase
MNDAVYLGIDIGASSFKYGLVVEGTVTQERNIAIDPKVASKTLLIQLFAGIKDLWREDIMGIGVGVPGIVDSERGLIVDLQNIPAWCGLPLAEIMNKQFKVPVMLNNDAHCFAFGELRYGAAKDWKNFVGITLGTGLGMGIVINNQLYKGVLSGAGELGMLPYKKGIIEQYTASFFFTNNYEASAAELYIRAQQGDAFALEAYNTYGHHLGEAVKVVLSLLAPEGVIFGGSIVKAWPFFSASLASSIAAFPYKKQLDHFALRQSPTMNSALLGAVALLASDQC